MARSFGTTDACGEDEGAEQKKTWEATVEKKDFIIEVLWKKWKKDRLTIPAYQRGFVWERGLCDMLVETVLMGLAIPEIWLHARREGKNGGEKLEVVDGQQRLKTIFAFIEGHYPSKKGDKTAVEFRPKDMECMEEINGKTYKELSQRLQEKYMDYGLSVRVIGAKTDAETVYEIYRRINSGSKNLSEQQVRKAAFWGPYIKMLDELAEGSRVLRSAYAHDMREADRELILRFFAMHDSPNKFKPPMYKFLNRHLQAKRFLPEAEQEELKTLFNRTLDLAVFVFGEDRIFRKDPSSKSIDVNLWDTVMSVFAKYKHADFVSHQDAMRKDLEALLNDRQFSELLRGPLTQKRLNDRNLLYENRVKSIVSLRRVTARRGFPLELK